MPNKSTAFTHLLQVFCQRDVNNDIIVAAGDELQPLNENPFVLLWAHRQIEHVPRGFSLSIIDVFSKLENNQKIYQDVLEVVAHGLLWSLSRI